MLIIHGTPHIYHRPLHKSTTKTILWLFHTSLLEFWPGSLLGLFFIAHKNILLDLSPLSANNTLELNEKEMEMKFATQHKNFTIVRDGVKKETYRAHRDGNAIWISNEKGIIRSKQCDTVSAAKDWMNRPSLNI